MVKPKSESIRSEVVVSEAHFSSDEATMRKSSKYGNRLMPC